MAEFILEVSGVSKKFSGKTVLNEVSLKIPRSSAFGLIGRNGAGKTTFIKLVLGFLRPSAGSINFIRVRPGDNFSGIGYLPEFQDYHPLFTGREYLMCLAEISGMTHAAAVSKTDEMLKLTGMEGVSADRRMAYYSKGMLQKIGIAQALLHSPEFIILDEPFSGLDPFAQKELRDIIFGLKKNGKTILICSHILSHLEKICDNVALIHKGRIICSGDMASLLVKNGRYKLLINNAPADITSELIKNGNLMQSAGEGYIIEEKKPGDKETVLKMLIESGAFIDGLVEVRDTLDDYFNSAVSSRKGD